VTGNSPPSLYSLSTPCHLSDTVCEHSDASYEAVIAVPVYHQMHTAAFAESLLITYGSGH